MKQFQYTAADSDGKRITNTILCHDVKEALDELNQKKMVVLQLKEIKRNQNKMMLDRLMQRPPSVMDRMLFSKQMGAMLKANIHITVALTTMTRQSRNQMFIETIKSIVQSLEQGNTMHEAMSRHPKVFNHIYLSLIQTGEETGSLDTIFMQLGQMLERDMVLARKVRGAMTYPIIVLIFALLLTSYMITSIIPQFAGILTNLNAPLPPITRFMIGLSGFVTSYGWFVLLAAGGLYFAANRFYASEKGRRFVDHWLLKLPVFGNMLTKSILARFSRSMSIMLANAIPIIRTLDISKGVMNNRSYQDGLEDIIKSIQEGKSISQSFARHPNLFPPILLSMMETGDDAGQLDNMLHEAAVIYEGEAMELAENLSATLEPFMVIFIGGIILTIVLSMFLPYFSIINKLSNPT